MICSIKRLVGTVVQTVSGFVLGHVADFEVDTDMGRIQKMSVKPSGLIKGFANKNLFIDWTQIIEIKENVVIVDDSVSKESEKSSIRSSVPASIAMASDLPETE